MKLIFWIGLVIGIVLVANMVLDYYGYYIEWKWAAISLGAGLPIIQAIRVFIKNPVEEVQKIQRKINVK